MVSFSYGKDVARENQYEVRGNNSEYRQVARNDMADKIRKQQLMLLQKRASWPA